MSNLPNEDLDLIQRIDARLTELKELKAQHAFALTRIAGTGANDFAWTCRCGASFIQLEGDTDIHERLMGHIAEVQS